MEYKGYHAAVSYDHEAGVFHGEMVGTRDVIFFEGSSVEELDKEFRFYYRRLSGYVRRARTGAGQAVLRQDSFAGHAGCAPGGYGGGKNRGKESERLDRRDG